MKREIKFRVWDIKNKRMISPEEIARIHFNDGLPYAIMGWNDQVLIDKDFILMQYTGLKDKNGKEIWEEDIVDIQHPHKNRHYWGEIIFDDGRFNGKDFNFPHHDNPIDIWESDEYIEVIGNIFENPDLLIPAVSSSDTVKERK